MITRGIDPFMTVFWFQSEVQDGLKLRHGKPLVQAIEVNYVIYLNGGFRLSTPNSLMPSAGF